MTGSLNNRKENSKKTKIEARVLNKTIVKRYRRGARNAKRRCRRKKSKKAYISMLKKGRITRETEELCSSIQEVDVVDMEELPELSSLPREVAEWQRQDQIAYWKSRAISFEIENKMLREHLRNVYADQIQQDYNQSQAWPSASSTTQQQRYEKKGKAALKQNCQDKVKVLPKEPIGKNRLTEMEKIYGDVAPKIMGMETAIELNYQRLMEEAPAYWPNIPLKL
ncbi:gem-associated protein 8 isoform X2 [Dendroctonus ponderosae]|uniref:gem-associated protein 8 isoform X2 n=1 Tax=Dendroctonus ponderosae TaxID=77166 RepID=UPI0020356D6C|nr:gem-associated protein 8 isoform X2 [Dendroctonus ponderosae]KAH1018058.1 hypothetical protein HUJ05_005883 [Dendroctonus ponderosae]